MRTVRILFFTAAFLALSAVLIAPAGAARLEPDRPVPAAWASTAYDIDIPILGYHKIDLSAPTQWYVTAEEFARQMDVLQYYGYQTISLDDYLQYADGSGHPPEKPVIITFDDGFESVYQYAAPVLKAREMTATFFVITGKLGEDAAHRQSNTWQSGEPPANHLIWPEVAALYADGFSIESHTVNHYILTDLNAAALAIELQQSRLSIQTHLPGNASSFLAYPYGYGAENTPQAEAVRVQAGDAGYLAAVGFPERPPEGLANPSLHEPLALPRKAVLSGHSRELNPSNPWWFFMRRVDPDFPLPNASVSPEITFQDASGPTTRTVFIPGETITMILKVSNYGSVVPVIASLELSTPIEWIYRSHEAIPNQDVSSPALLQGYRANTFSYTFTIPAAEPPQAVSFTLKLRDPSYLLGYHTSPLTPVFTLGFSQYLPMVTR